MKRIIATPGAPAAVGPYSQAVIANGLLFTAGQIPLDPKTGELVDTDIETATKRVLDNIRAVLETEGLAFRHVVKTTVFMTDLGEFTAMNETYATFFGSEPPARSTVGVAALPAGARVEIEAVALA